MKLGNLLEAMKRDLYSALQNKEVLTHDDHKFIIQLTAHLHDERENYGGIARGDTMMPKEIQSNIRIGLKKLLEKFSIDELVESEKSFAISAKLKKKGFFITKKNNKKVKVDLYASMIIAIERVKFTKNTIRVKIITILPPKEHRVGKPAKSRFQVEI